MSQLHVQMFKTVIFRSLGLGTFGQMREHEPHINIVNPAGACHPIQVFATHVMNKLTARGLGLVLIMDASTESLFSDTLDHSVKEMILIGSKTKVV